MTVAEYDHPDVEDQQFQAARAAAVLALTRGQAGMTLPDHTYAHVIHVEGNVFLIDCASDWRAVDIRIVLPGRPGQFHRYRRESA